MSRPIFLLSDFGLADTYVGQVKAVIAGIAPLSHVVDLTHEVAPFAVAEGAWLLESALGVLPEDAVVVAVVDPGVGGARCELAVAAAGRVFVGPDNGLLSAALAEADRERATWPGGSRLAPAGVDARELCAPQFRRAHVSATFHGRDIFAPAAAHIAAGLDYRQLGPPVPDVMVLPPFRGYPRGFGELQGEVIHIDRYGNLVTTIRAAQLFPAFELEVCGYTVDRHVRTFGDATLGVPFCHADSSGFVAVSINQGDVAATLGVSRGDPVLVRTL